MKTYFVLILMTSLLFVSCKDDTNDLAEFTDFSGVYLGLFNCDGDLAEAKGS